MARSTQEIPEVTSTIVEHPHPAAHQPTVMRPVEAPRVPTSAVTGMSPFMRRMRAGSFLLLWVVAMTGIALSWAVLQSTSAVMLGKEGEPLTGFISYLFPITVDTLIVGSSGAFIVGSSVGKPLAGWRLIAHVASGTSLFLNATAAATLAAVPWHMAPPLATILIVEISAKQLLGEHKALTRTQSISMALWLTAPVESLRTKLRELRQAGYSTSRRSVGQNEAAMTALEIALPGRRAKKTRKIIARQLRSGSATPADVLVIADQVFHSAGKADPAEVLMRVAASAVLGILPPVEADHPTDVEVAVVPEEAPCEIVPAVEAPRPATSARYRAKTPSRRPGTTKPVGAAPSLDAAVARAVEDGDVSTPGWYRQAQHELGGSSAWWRGKVTTVARERMGLAG